MQSCDCVQAKSLWRSQQVNNDVRCTTEETADINSREDGDVNGEN